MLEILQSDFSRGFLPYSPESTSCWVMQRWKVCGGIANGMPAISIFIVYSHIPGCIFESPASAAVDSARSPSTHSVARMQSPPSVPVRRFFVPQPPQVPACDRPVRRPGPGDGQRAPVAQLTPLRVKAIDRAVQAEVVHREDVEAVQREDQVHLGRPAADAGQGVEHLDRGLVVERVELLERELVLAHAP